MKTPSNILKQSLKYLFLFLGLVSLFVLARFPYSDLTSLAAQFIAQVTPPGVNIQFDQLDLNFTPSPSVELTDLRVITDGLPEIKATTASLKPDILTLLALKPGATIAANNIFGGNVKASFALTRPDSKGATEHRISLNIEKLDLKHIAEFIPATLVLSGDISAQSQFVFDQSFSKENVIPLKINSQEGIQFVSISIPSQLGTISLNNINFSQLSAEASLFPEKGFKSARLLIEDFQVGGPTDALSAQVRGDIELFAPMGEVGPLRSRLNLKVRVSTSNAKEHQKSTEMLAVKNLLELQVPPNKTSGLNTEFLFTVKGSPPMGVSVAPLARF